MAVIKVLSPEEQVEWDQWLSEVPDCIKELVAKLPPTKLYRLKSSGHRVTLISYSENGTVTVAVTGKYNLIDFPRQVFGIAPDDLVECDLPAEGEPLGEELVTEEEIAERIKLLRQVKFN